MPRRVLEARLPGRGRQTRRARTWPFVLEPFERRTLLAGGSIAGTVFSDFNSNGIRDANEPALAGWTVYLDTNDNGLMETSEPRVVTPASGAYRFDNLPAGQYVLRELLKSGYVQTSPAAGGTVLVQPDEQVVTNQPNAPRGYSAGEIIVAVEGSTGKTALARKLVDRPGLAGWVDLPRSRDLFSVDGSTVLELRLAPGVDPKLAAQRFENLAGVRWTQVNWIYDDIDPQDTSPNDPQYLQQYHHPLMNNDDAWGVAVGDPRIIVGITDDGLDLNHEDLYQNVWVNPVEIPLSRRLNLTDINADGYISMAELNSPLNRGAFKANDVNADGRISALDLIAPMTKSGTGSDTGLGGWADGIDQGGNTYIDDITGWDFWNNDNDTSPNATGTHGTHVSGILGAGTNNGVGVAGTGSGASIMPIRFYANQGGTWTSAMVASAYAYAANNGARILNTSYNVDIFVTDNVFLAALDYMYGRGVLHLNSAGNNTAANPVRQNLDHSLYVVNTDSLDVKYSTSNWGWGLDLAAPGAGILSTFPGSTYGLSTGTSMATPNAAGAAALIWSLHPNWTREQVAAQLWGTTSNIDALNPTFAGLLGAGRVDSIRALSETLRAPRVKSMGGLPANGGFTATKPATFRLDVANIFDPATMNASSFELRAAGADALFGTADDYLIPISITFGGSQSSQYRVGTNRVNLTVPGPMPADTYRFSMLASARDPFGQSVDGNADGIAGDAYTRTFTLTTPSNPFRVNLADGQIVSNASFANHDLITPKVLVGGFTWALAPQKLIFVFSEDVSSSLSTGDLTVVNVTTGQPANTSSFALAYDAVGNVATFSIPTVLADGDYVATLRASSISDPSGNLLDGNFNGAGGDDYASEFFFFTGDANHDRIVNLVDFNIVAANYNLTGRNYSQGDFNYDGAVNLVDFTILAGRFNGSPILPGAPVARTAGADPALAEIRMAELTQSDGMRPDSRLDELE